MEDVCLQWNEQKNSISKGMHALLQAEECIDVTLACDGQFLKAHKSVLSICSDYFKNIFMSTPCKHPVVILQGAKLDHVKALIQFMYCGEAKVAQSELRVFLNTAATLQINGLLLSGDQVTMPDESHALEPHDATLTDEETSNENHLTTPTLKIKSEPIGEPELEDCEIDISNVKAEPLDDVETSSPSHDPTDLTPDSEEIPLVDDSDTPAILNCMSLAFNNEMSEMTQSEAESMDMLPSAHFLACSPGASSLIIDSDTDLQCSSPEPSTSSNSKDTRVHDILKLWGFRGSIKTFEEEEVDYEDFMNLTSKDIRNLFPNVKQRTKFNNLYQSYIENNGAVDKEGDSDQDGKRASKRIRKSREGKIMEQAKYIQSRANDLAEMAKMCQQNYQFSTRPPTVETSVGRPLTVEEVCEKYTLKDYHIEFTQQQRQLLTTFNLFQQYVTPYLMNANPMVKMPRLFMLVGAKWRQFIANNPFIERV